MNAGIADRKWSIEDMVDLLPELQYNTRPKNGHKINLTQYQRGLPIVGSNAWRCNASPRE